MGWAEAIARGLKASRIEMVAQVPDEVTGRLLDILEADQAFTVVPVTREEEGVGVLAGGYLGGKRGALILQGSGVGNAINALASLDVACQIPVLLIISERGRLGEFNPVQVPLGRAVPKIFEALGIQTFPIDAEDEAGPMLEEAANLAFNTEMPVALLLSKRLTGGKTLR